MLLHSVGQCVVAVGFGIAVVVALAVRIDLVAPFILQKCILFQNLLIS